MTGLVLASSSQWPLAYCQVIAQHLLLSGLKGGGDVRAAFRHSCLFSGGYLCFTGCCNREHVESVPANVTAISFEIVGWVLDFRSVL